MSFRTIIATAAIGLMFAGPALAQGRSGTAPGQMGTSPGQSMTSPGRSGTSPGQLGTTPGQMTSGNPGSGGMAPGQNPAFKPPGQTVNTPGKKKVSTKRAKKAL
jgi:hypothetical protein